MKIYAACFLVAALGESAPVTRAQPLSTPDRDVVEFPIDKSSAKKAALQILDKTGGVAEWAKDWDVENPRFGSFEITIENGNECAPAGRYVVVHFNAKGHRPYPKSFILEAGTLIEISSGGGISMPELISGFREGLHLCH
jgi:hypothetical protein